MSKELPFSNHIQELRKAKKLTQQELADAIGMTRQTIVAIEKGKYSPSLEAAFRIAQTLEQSLTDVFVWSE
ncbi:helix-turn-helix transcriptional regulator [Hirschia baltica]|uniref:Transcriptional regulator, XRE family n=1 Tax=Hirschia baltica (strain ATCC 49814 / DSM 5838 / IFAM 1418) TaxID=582402 RepID=C6XNB6_HIRBI|nr:helix-turn-helix transcriptional regulator [Hirschia baltica]ACT60060.1 transcriptional regulator, XRE family [Hirschia baltica ATCC 49814]